MFEQLQGEMVGIRTTTMYYTGRFQRYDSGCLVLSEATWILETGAWSEFAKDLEGEEYAAYPPETEVWVFATQAVEVFAADEQHVQAKRLARRLHIKK